MGDCRTGQVARITGLGRFGHRPAGTGTPRPTASTEDIGSQSNTWREQGHRCTHCQEWTVERARPPVLALSFADGPESGGKGWPDPRRTLGAFLLGTTLTIQVRRHGLGTLVELVAMAVLPAEEVGRILAEHPRFIVKRHLTGYIEAYPDARDLLERHIGAAYRLRVRIGDLLVYELRPSRSPQPRPGPG